MEKEQQQLHAMHSPQADSMDIGASFQPPTFSLNNGAEAPPDQGHETDETEGLRPEIVEQLETPLPDEGNFNDDLELESELESENSPGIQRKTSAAPVQMASRKKKKKKNRFQSKNGFTVSFKPQTSKQRNYLLRFRKMNVLDQKEADLIIQYIIQNKTGTIAPVNVRAKLRSGFRLNPTSGRFINANKGIVDFAKYNKTGFSFGNQNSSSGAKGHHGIEIPHSSLNQNVGHQVSYKNAKGEDITISPNALSGKLEKSWSQRSNGKPTNKSAPQMQSGQFLAYLAQKRKKLLDEKAKCNIFSNKTRYFELNKAVVDMSEMIAELSTQMAVDKFMPGATTRNAHTQGGKQGEFDQVHQNGSDYYAMECKGGGSSLGGRKNPNGSGKVQQGSSDYTTDLLNNYKKDRSSGIRNLGTEMETARSGGKLHYMHAKQTFNPFSGDISPHLSLKEFNI